MSALVVNDRIVHYEVLGRGRPLLLIHGWVGSWRLWIPTMQAVSSEFRTYALDLWGFGDTDHAPDHYNLETQVVLVRSFMELMGITRAAFIGHGFGGLVALHLTKLHPESVERMMLVSVPLAPEALSERIKNGTPPNIAEWLLVHNEDTEAVHLEVAKTDPLILRNWFPEQPTTPWIPDLTELEAPSVLVYGTKDPAVGQQNVPLALQDGTPNHLIEFTTSGHFPMFDEKNRFSRLVKDFLALPSGEPMSKLQLKEEWKRRLR